MERLSTFSVILFTFGLLLLAPNLTKAALVSEADEIPYQINNSDHIIIGKVSGNHVYSDHTIGTIKTEEWLYNPLFMNTIKVRTEKGTSMDTEDQPELIQNESVLLMLNDRDGIYNDEDIDKQLFIITCGFPGKHPISDRNAVIKELKAQGKWKGENQIGNMTNQTEKITNTETTGSPKENVTEKKTVDKEKAENTGTVDKQKEKTDTPPKSNRTPFMSSFWVLAIVVGTVTYVGKMK
jgi:hypothetical protein